MGGGGGGQKPVRRAPGQRRLEHKSAEMVRARRLGTAGEAQGTRGWSGVGDESREDAGFYGPGQLGQKCHYLVTSPQLRLRGPNAGGLGSTPGQGTRSHGPELKLLPAAMKTQDPMCDN